MESSSANEPGTAEADPADQHIKSLAHVIQRETEKLDDRRKRAGVEFAGAVKAWEEARALSPAEEKYQEVLAQPTSERGTVGMAFSGGGIRSAAFNFGLVQGLARYRILPWVDYLTSVSGGGFTASCLTSLLSRLRLRYGEDGNREYFPFNTQWEYFPFNPALQAFDWQGVAQQRPPSASEKDQKIGPPLARGHNTQLAYLRNKGNYLTPRMGVFGRDVMRGLGAVLIRISYTVFLFLAVMFALAAFHYGLTAALTPGIQEQISLPSRQTSDADGKTIQALDAQALISLLFDGRRADPSSASIWDQPAGQHLATAGIGLLLAVLFVYVLNFLYREDPTQKYRLRMWRSPVSGVTKATYLRMARLRHGSQLGYLILGILSIVLLIGWLSKVQTSAPAATFYWGWLPLLLLNSLAAAWLVFFHFQDYSWVGQGLQEEERFDRLAIYSVVCSYLWSLSLWLAWLRLRAFEANSFEGALFWIWLPTVFIFGGLLGLVFYRNLPFGYRVRLADSNIPYEQQLNRFQKWYYDRVLEKIPAEVPASEPPPTQTAAGGSGRRGFTRSIWGVAAYRSIFWVLQGLSLYGLALFLLMALLAVPHYFSGIQTGGAGSGLPLASLLISAAWAAVLAHVNRSQGSASGSWLAKIISLPEGIRNQVLGLLVLILSLSLIFLFQTRLDGLPVFRAYLLGLGALAIFLLAGRLADFNYLTPHYFFRDRMADIYLMTEVEVQAEGDAGSKGIKSVRDHREDWLSWLNPEDCSAPYHLVQTALNLPGTWHLRLKDRRSLHFILSKYYCGSEITGYVKTDQYRGGATKYSRAIALSGAAISPGMGYHTFFAQAFMTTLLNIRLGLWMTNPDRYQAAEIAKNPRPHQGERQAFWPAYLWDEARGRINERKAMINLTDGEHTGDNIGLYPLFQRRCTFIFAGDGGLDPEGTCNGLFSVLRQVKMDLGIEVDIDVGGLKPAKYDRENEEVEPAQRHFALGKILYPPIRSAEGPDLPAKQGWLIYFKPAITKEDPGSILNYWENHKVDFPHPTTADQFFSEEQFEVQRHLGEWSVEHTLRSLIAYLEEQIQEQDKTKATSPNAPPTPAEMMRNFVRKLADTGELDYGILMETPDFVDALLASLGEVCSPAGS